MDRSGSFIHILKPLKVLSTYIQAPYGTFAILGNHDSYLMTRYEEEAQLELLVNESVEILKDGQKILITGTDDPFDYFTESAMLCLETRGYDFKIAMIHTPELARWAAQNKYDLYLCGHTHGGQICLKEGIPLISHSFEGKKIQSWVVEGRGNDRIYINRCRCQRNPGAVQLPSGNNCHHTFQGTECRAEN